MESESEKRKEKGPLLMHVRAGGAVAQGHQAL